MKITPTDYANLENALHTLLANRPKVAENYHAQGLSHTRFRWDAFHASKVDVQHLYTYLDDSNVDTALRRILGTDFTK